VDRGLVILPARKNMRHTIVVPNETQFPNGELLQADVAHPDSMGPDIPIEEKLVELRESEQPANKRIGLVLTGFLEQGKKRFTIADWISAVGKSKSLAKNDIQAALSLGLVSRDISGTIGNFIVYKVEPILPNFIRWEEISKTNIQVLETIVRSFGTRFFTKQAISEASGIPMANIAYNLKSLRRFSVINMKRDGSTNYLYCLAIPIEEAVRKLHEMGFSPVELVG
jgi:predicted transcriptional regulator